MKALYFEETGDAGHVLSLKQFDKPIAGENQVIVKLLGSPINPSDFFFISGTYRFKPEFPQIAGLEGAGIIESTGQGANLSVGILVSFFSRNAWAEYTAVYEKDVMVLPADFPVDKASQFALNPITAWGLLERAGVNEGDWLLITAGNSVVSKLLIQIARLRNINIIATVRASKDAATLVAYGAHVINVTDDNLLERVQEITDNKGVNVAFDAVGGKTGTDVLKCLQAGGRLIIYSRLSPDPIQLYNADVLYKNISITGFGIRAYLESKTPAQKDEIIQSLIKIIGNPEFKMEVAKSYALDDYQEAIATVVEGKNEGKVLFKF
ncbi:quinone oxidoreductase family protein [Mucilaginibacter pocheonensis]|uniref:NADPH:quinone reductase-like Zn-dependent oxidoreductase n=1 Tax=Mucilaginibacter pocheonensis TaxID=398050 RepID=A0ABU1TB17_9SPHI|nr:zinc-dependent alcohol dehydrogenase family protein [Mucilaginibacter pocheonensis]MDR6942524.1 NADPH:quinone reductase-like Zn-dependent oxidoreductase [Mucilaginibacter pocheonensis]